MLFLSGRVCVDCDVSRGVSCRGVCRSTCCPVKSKLGCHRCTFDAAAPPASPTGLAPGFGAVAAVAGGGVASGSNDKHVIEWDVQVTPFAPSARWHSRGARDAR